jgi:hypothetical protein
MYQGNTNHKKTHLHIIIPEKADLKIKSFIRDKEGCLMAKIIKKRDQFLKYIVESQVCVYLI